MLRDLGLIEDVEHVIFQYLPLSACKSILFTSKASNLAMRAHVFTRKEKELRRHLENWLWNVNLMNLLPYRMQGIETHYVKHYPDDKPTLSLSLSCAILFTSASLSSVTLNRLNIALRVESISTQTEKTPVSLPSELAKKTCTDENINQLKNSFAQAETEQLKTYLSDFRSRAAYTGRLHYVDHKILLTYLILHLTDIDQKVALDLLRNDFSDEFDGAKLCNHLHNIDSKLTACQPTQAITDYFIFLWQKILLLETSTAYVLAESRLLSSSNIHEASLPFLPLNDLRKIFRYYFKQLDANITNIQRHRAIRITTLLAPRMTPYLKRDLILKFSELIDGHYAFFSIAPVLLSLCTLIGSLTGRLHELALAKYLARLPSHPGPSTPNYYFASVLHLSKYANNLTVEKINLLLAIIKSFGSNTVAPDNARRLNAISDNVTLLIRLVTGHPQIIEPAFYAWQLYVTATIDAQSITTFVDDTIPANIAAILSAIPTIAPLLNLEKKISMRILFNSHLEHADLQIQKLAIYGLEQLVYFLPTTEQLLVIEALWQVYCLIDKDFLYIQNEALRMLNNIALRITNVDVQAKISELVATDPHPDPDASSMLQSLTNQHTTFFKSNSTANKPENYAHTSSHHHPQSTQLDSRGLS